MSSWNHEDPVGTPPALAAEPTSGRSHCSRREVLKAAAMGVGLVAGGSVLGACSSSSAAAPALAFSKPKLGGTLKIGMTGGGADDVITPLVWPSALDGLRVFQLYNSLTALDKNAQPQLSLAEEFTPNSNATEWTIRLRKGITFHNGKPLTADDVIYTYQQISNPKNPLTGSILLAPVDVANIKKLDSLTMRVPCYHPYQSFYSNQACYQFMIIPDGSNPGTVKVGTGPFKYESFTPGEQSTFTRNDNYWQSGPYVDRVVITDVADDTAQINGLVSGTFNIIGGLLGDDVNAVKSAGFEVLVEDGGSYAPITMRLDQPPFNDIRVRQAMRLIVDRPEMLDLCMSGYGFIGNDLFGIYDPSYNHLLPQRQQDIGQAKFLLKQAGYDGDLTVTLVTSGVAAGTIECADVFAQQAVKAGVKVNLSEVPVATLFGPQYLKWIFAQDWWNYYPYLPNAQEACIKGAVFNECHVNDARYTKLFNEANAIVDLGLRTEIIHEMQTLEYEGEASGYIVPYFIPSIDGFSSSVKGLTPSKTSNVIGGYDLASIWLD
jgi:peptide/nickel transport system substrate-binding protein